MTCMQAIVAKMDVMCYHKEKRNAKEEQEERDRAAKRNQRKT